MRIVQVAPTYAPCVGGAERLLQAVSERLVGRGHEVTVLTFDAATQHHLTSAHGAGLPRSELREGVRILRLDPGGGARSRLLQWWLRQRGGWRSTRWLLGPEFEFTSGRPSGFELQRELARVQTDVIVSVNWHFGSALWALNTSRRRRIPHVAVPILHIDRDWARREIYRRMLPRCAAAIALNEAEADFLRARGTPSVSVAGGGIEPARYLRSDGALVRMRHGIGTQPVVGFVGRQDESKGVLTLLAAMPAVWQELPEAILLLAGPSAHRQQKVSEHLAGMPARQRERVRFADDFADEEGPSIMAACDLLAQPSTEEAFGLVLIEAWMCERPVIAADIAASRALIEPGRDGWLVPPEDPAALAARIVDLLGDPDRRRAFGAHGKRKVLERFTWDRVVDRWEATLGEVASRERHP